MAGVPQRALFVQRWLTSANQASVTIIKARVIALGFPTFLETMIIEMGRRLVESRTIVGKKS